MTAVPPFIMLLLFAWACWIMMTDMLEDIFKGPRWRDKQ